MSDSRKFRYDGYVLQSMVSADLKIKQKIGTVERHNHNIFKQGEEWYKSGHTLEEAEPKLRTNINFVQGYDRAARIDKINTDLFKLGMDYFEKGILFSDIPANYRKNEHFVNGYNEALRFSIIKKNSRR